MTPTRLKTPKELHARRLAYELDFEWYPDHHHAHITAKSFAEHPSQGGPDAQPIVRRFEEASDEIKDLIDPTWRLGEDYLDEGGEVLREDSRYHDYYAPAEAAVAARL